MSFTMWLAKGRCCSKSLAAWEGDVREVTVRSWYRNSANMVRTTTDQKLGREKEVQSEGGIRRDSNTGCEVGRRAGDPGKVEMGEMGQGRECEPTNGKFSFCARKVTSNNGDTTCNTNQSPQGGHGAQESSKTCCLVFL